MIGHMKKGEFLRRKWEPRDVLYMKDGSRSTIYTGQPYDPEKMTLREKAWSHDHCEACNWELIDSQGDEHAFGYFNGYNWLCEECYRLLIVEDRLKIGQ